jgi:hypothetical protein
MTYSLSFFLLLRRLQSANTLLPQAIFVESLYMFSKLFLLKVVVDVYDKNSVMARVSKSVQMLLPVKIKT